MVLMSAVTPGARRGIEAGDSQDYRWFFGHGLPFSKALIVRRFWPLMLHRLGAEVTLGVGARKKILPARPNRRRQLH